MIKINLLPPIKKEPFWQAGHFFSFSAVVFILCLGANWGYLFYAEYNLESELRQAKQQHELFKPTLTQMQIVSTKRQAITSRQTILLSLTQERPPLYAAIARLGAIIPQEVWLTDVASDKNSLKISGMAKSYPDIAAFLKQVQDDALFSDFALARTEQDRAFAKFEFTVKFKGM